MSKKAQRKSGSTKLVIIAILVILVASGVLAAISGLFSSPKQQQTTKQSSEEVAVIETNMGTIIFRFHPEVAPKTVENFKKIANSGFYNGTHFHRVIPGFMIQGGDPNSKNPDRSTHGMGGPGYSISAEFSNLSHKRGVVSMARGNDINSAGSQFFIVVKDTTSLDGQYTIFGEVTQGMDVVDKIVNVKTDGNDNPIDPVIMQRVYIKQG